MQYKEIVPGEKLKPFVKCYFIIQSDIAATFEGTLFPAGHVEIVFNLGEATWKSATARGFQTDPPIELVGQITQPVAINSTGKTMMLGIRFYSHTAACFFKEELEEFSNQISDLRVIVGAPADRLHNRLLEELEMSKRIELVENFLVDRLSVHERKLSRIRMIGQIVNQLQGNTSFSHIQTIAAQYGITSRYLQKLFLQHVGVTPKLYGRISRFQHSLKYIHKKDVSLTTTAYTCGYSDQSHFIKEFKFFSGITPSTYLSASSSTKQFMDQ